MVWSRAVAGRVLKLRTPRRRGGLPAEARLRLAADPVGADLGLRGAGLRRVRLRADPVEAGLGPVVDRARTEHGAHDAGLARAGDPQRDEAERAPRPHAARARQELADRVAQAAALRHARAVGVLLDERRADPTV